MQVETTTIFFLSQILAAQPISSCIYNYGPNFSRTFCYCRCQGPRVLLHTQHSLLFVRHQVVVVSPPRQIDLRSVSVGLLAHTLL